MQAVLGAKTLGISWPVTYTSKCTEHVGPAQTLVLQRRTRLKGTGDDGAWATVGVLVRKSAPRESASGNMYSVWSLSNLDGARLSRQATCMPQVSQLPYDMMSWSGLEPTTRRVARA